MPRILLALSLLGFLVAGEARCQDPVAITPFQVFSFNAQTGQVQACAGCSVYTYAAGTNTPTPTYTNSTLMVQNTNPVLTNSQGYAAGADGSTITGIWVGAVCLKLVTKDANAVTLWTQDNICDEAQILKALLAGATGAAQIGFEQPSSSLTTVAAVLDSLYIWDYLYATPVLACTQATGASRPLALTRAWTGLASMDLTGCSIDATFGGSLQPAAAATIKLPADIISTLQQKVYDASTFDGTHYGFAFPNGAPSVYGPTQFGFSIGGTATSNDAAFTAAANALPVSTGNLKTTVSGQSIRSGSMQIPANPACYPLGNILMSGGVGLLGVPGANGGSPIVCLQMALGTATSGAEQFVFAIDPTNDSGASPNETFGTTLENIQIDCNGGVFYGNNASSSGLLFYGAQGSKVDNVQVNNCGMRGLVIGANGSNFSGIFEMRQTYIAGVAQGPGLEADTSSVHYGSISVVNVNPLGTYLDSDMDPNPGVLIDGFNNDFGVIEVEQTWQPITIKAYSSNSIHQLTMSPSGAARPIGVLIKGNSDLTTIDGWFTFGPSPNLYTNAVVDRTYGYSQPGNLIDYPVGSYKQTNNSSLVGALDIGGTPNSNSSGGLSFTKQYMNATPALVTCRWSLLHAIASGTSPAYEILEMKPPGAGCGAGSYAWIFAGPLGDATSSSGNYSSVTSQWEGSYWNGSAEVTPTASCQLVIGTGTSPTQVWTCTLPSGGQFQLSGLPTSGSGSGGGYMCRDSVGVYVKSSCP